ncbi:hypothetical protein HZY83_07545 [Gemella sp. GH3]|uniref:hypothetical protein n=1 Tax=unclassified Gemella TaxID=2624949 RepID=UPI0015D0133C|nr:MULTISPECIES: hypothetical protein [unclassified Gemella]MBF0714528.1 hypothetical protein [Gemella sp. GH3.1]NYS51480.1 hypothetical protein [Gemella sp. GH3]
MNVKAITLDYSIESSPVDGDLDIKFKNTYTEFKGSNIVIEQTADVIKSLMIYDNGLIVYSEIYASRALIKTNKKIINENGQLFIEN